MSIASATESDLSDVLRIEREAFGEDEVAVACNKPVEVRLRDRMFSLDEGRNTVPQYVAVHLVCRKLATLDI